MSPKTAELFGCKFSAHDGNSKLQTGKGSLPEGLYMKPLYLLHGTLLLHC